MFRLRLFGGASIEGDDGPLTGRGVQRRRLALLALLAVARGRGLTRDRVIGYLWPDADPERSRHLLSDSVYRINQALDGDAVFAAGEDLRLNPDRLPSDVWEFGDAIERGEWERAVTLHAAPFLDGFFVADSGEFDRWADIERERLFRDRSRALEALARSAETCGDHVAAVRWWRALAAADRFSSRVALHLMRALEVSGDRAAAVQHARAHSALVRSELGVEPDPEIRRTEQRLRTAERADRAIDVPAMTSSPTDAAGPVQDEPDIGAHARAHATAPATDDDTLEDAAGTNAADSRHAAPPVHDAANTPITERRRRRPRRELVLAALLFALVAAVSWRLTREPPAPPPPNEATSIAVLPFEDLSADQDQEYFTDGITEELLVRLSRVEGLHVVGRTSSFAFKGRDVDVKEIAQRLGVTVVLGGSVLKSGDRLRIFAQLIDATNGYQLWSDRYELEQRHIFDIQDEIARAIVTRLRGRLAVESVQPETAVPTEDPEAYNLYLRGRFEWHKRTEEGLRNAAEYLRQATSRSPTHARAWAGLGDAYAVLGFYDYLPPAEAFPRAAQAAIRALEIDARLAEPHATLGYVALYYEWDWDRAEAEFRRAIELDPGYSTGHQWYANYLNAMGRFDEAVREMRTAQDLDPLSRIANAALGWVLYYSGENQRAIDQLSHTLELDPRFELAYLWRGIAHEQLGSISNAIADLERAVEMSGGSAISSAALARAHAIAGDSAEARAIAAQLESRGADAYIPSFEIAKIYEALGDRAATIRWLERALQQRSHSMVFLAVDPQLARLRDDREFMRLVRSVANARTAPAGGSIANR